MSDGGELEEGGDSSTQPDPRKAVQIFVCGKKGYGKTELAYHLFDGYPYDRLAIDINHDLKMPEDTLYLEHPLPSRWPGELYRERFGSKKRQTLCFRPDAGDAEYYDDIDRAIALAFAHIGKKALLVEEAHEAAPQNHTPPHMRRALRHGRHRDLTLILDTPRPMTIDPLSIGQADYVYAFRLPNPTDRRRVAENIGWDPKDFDAAMTEVRKYEFLRYDHEEEDLAHYPPLPAHYIKHHKT